MDGVKGWSRAGLITVPESIVEPAAVLVQKIGIDPLDGAAMDYITHVQLSRLVMGPRGGQGAGTREREFIRRLCN